MRRRIALLLLTIPSLLLLPGENRAQGQSPKVVSSPTAIAAFQDTARYSLVVGSVLAPISSVNQQTGGTVDYWLGYLDLPQQGPRIRWASGMVSSSARRPRVLLRERLKNSTLEVREFHEGHRRTVEARIGMVWLSVSPATESAVSVLLRVARSYQAGQCATCTPPTRPGAA